MYELILFISRFSPGIKLNPWVRRALIYCVDDWAEFRTRIVMAEIDRDIEDIHRAWDEEQKQDMFTYSEGPSDGYKEQELLGGPMQLSFKWSEKPRESDLDF